MAPTEDPAPILIVMWHSTEDGADELFADLRRETQETWGHLLCQHGQFWGRAIERPKKFFWVIYFHDADALVLFKSHPDNGVFRARCALVGADHLALYRPALAYPLLPLVTAPITTFNYFRLKAEWELAPVENLVVACNGLLASRKLPGYYGYTWVIPDERGGEGLLIGGWETIEQHDQMGKDDEELVERYEELFTTAAKIDVNHAHFERYPPLS
ncbi:hypothetical protein K488DRAFT_68918 [Vararia minispora EC-137]|uniref:Uncharacterized protein n=1 Tax=Vararia minispora EC-137 TaxID=1314806 RepID=A0ACB8QTQ1_9AGAM|nr:hypothetical protein K488DRAFT_68918 [Vararia minispora EC-137]